MNKAELVSAIAEKTELKKVDAEKAVKAFVDVVTEELKKGGKVQLVGFGTFETIKIPASNAAKFKAGKALKDAINTKTKK